MHAILNHLQTYGKILCACEMWKSGQKWASFILKPVIFLLEMYLEQSLVSGERNPSSLVTFPGWADLFGNLR